MVSRSLQTSPQPVKFVTHELYAHRGTRTPEVTRTVLQTADLVQAFPLSEAQRKKIVDISYAVMEHLVASLDAFERIRDQVRQGQAKVDAGQLRIQASGQVVDLPSVVNLRKDVESFLYNAKLALRDTGELFDVFYGETFGVKFHKAREWLTNTFGADSSFAEMLAADAEWIEKLIRFRNAIEHPKTEPGGPLRIDDFALRQEGDKLLVVEPSWSQGDYMGSLVSDLGVMQQNLLTFYEDILVEALMAIDSPIAIYEIPEAERDKALPKRLAVTLREPIKIARDLGDTGAPDTR